LFPSLYSQERVRRHVLAKHSNGTEAYTLTQATLTEILELSNHIQKFEESLQKSKDVSAYQVSFGCMFAKITCRWPKCADQLRHRSMDSGLGIVFSLCAPQPAKVLEVQQKASTWLKICEELALLLQVSLESRIWR
jgi:hypothetical protein